LAKNQEQKATTDLPFRDDNKKSNGKKTLWLGLAVMIPPISPIAKKLRDGWAPVDLWQTVSCCGGRPWG
jgi:hypothetical protein